MCRNLFNQVHLIVQLVSAECARLIQAHAVTGEGKSNVAINCGDCRQLLMVERALHN